MNYDILLTGLTESTNYYVRAFCTLNSGVTYGNIKTFTTATPTYSYDISFMGGALEKEYIPEFTYSILLPPNDTDYVDEQIFQ